MELFLLEIAIFWFWCLLAEQGFIRRMCVGS